MSGPSSCCSNRLSQHSGPQRYMSTIHACLCRSGTRRSVACSTQSRKLLASVWVRSAHFTLGLLVLLCAQNAGRA